MVKFSAGRGRQARQAWQARQDMGASLAGYGRHWWNEERRGMGRMGKVGLEHVSPLFFSFFLSLHIRK